MSASEFWRGRRVFLTGHTGFKGGWLSLWLQHLGAEVTGFSLPPNTTPSLFEVADVASGMTSIFGDIRDRPALDAAMRACAPEIVLHLAAQPLVRRSYVDPTETYATNVLGLVNLFESVRAQGGVRAVVNVTSDKCYENREWLWGYRETDPMGGFDPYSSSKGCAELVTSAYQRSFFHQSQSGTPTFLASARAGNVIGGGDWAEDRLIPDIIRALSARKTLQIRRPGAVRPWQHVLEPLSGYLLLAQRLVEQGAAVAQGWNFGPDTADERTVQWIVDQMTTLWGEPNRWELDDDAGPHEAGLLKLDCSKARAILKWTPRWNLARALEETVAWHSAANRGDEMRKVTLAQIDGFVQTGNGNA
ncbi:CDP-glucose 4,6-dehydratase [Roseixanthobacter liquoris]|uniref:CDP-glucose 4,6-dehydratase n=1 Tax=Roseixanthobacter liquoris TaxID=3119921 RepID=UPI003726E1C4